MSFFQGESCSYSRAFLNSVLAAFKTAPADPLIDTGKLRLSKDPAYGPTPYSSIADLSAQEADYSGYTAGGYAVTVPNPVNVGATGQGLVLNQLFVSTTATPFVGANVYGWWIDDGTNVIAYEVFNATPTIGFSQPGDFLDMALTLPLTFNQSP